MVRELHPRLNVETATSIPHVLRIEQQKTPQPLEDAIGKFVDAATTYDSYHRSYTQLVEEMAEPLQLAQEKLSQAQISKGLAELQAKTKSTDVSDEFIGNQIRVALATSKRVPVFIKAFIRPWALVEHPVVSSAREREEQARLELNQLTDQYEERRKMLDERNKPVLEGMLKEVRDSEEKLFREADKIASGDFSIAKSYIGEYPGRADRVCTLYVRRTEADPQELNDFNDFLRRELHADEIGVEALARWHGKRYPFLIRGAKPDAQEYAVIPEEIKEKWRANRRRKFLQDIQG